MIDMKWINNVLAVNLPPFFKDFFFIFFFIITADQNYFITIPLVFFLRSKINTVVYVLFRLIVLYLYNIASCYMRLIYCLHGEFHITSSRHCLGLL